MFLSSWRPYIASGAKLPETVYHLLLYGQSLSVGLYGYSPISKFQPFKNLTFEGGPISVTDDVFTGTKWLLESTLETPCSGAANYAAEQTGDRFFTSTAGKSGYIIDALKKGSAWYQWPLKNLQYGHSRVKQIGARYRMSAICWMQGTHDQIFADTTREDYKAALKQLRVDLQADSHSFTGDNHTIPLFTYQLSVGPTEGEEEITLAQLDASEEDNNIYMVTPMYPFPTYDWVHLTNMYYYLLGQYFGRAVKKVIFDQQDWIPLQPSSITVSGLDITATFDVPNTPLVLDTDIVPTTADYGFSVFDDGGQKTISDVQLQSTNQIKITVTTALGSNPKLRYALDYLGDGMSLGGSYGGGSGNLRDSSPDVWNYGRVFDPVPMYNWCVHFDKPITT